ncbi:MAG: glycosyltransferase [Saprospiraceae bacterium]|nr:glycosyltransferase [Saprospiraceae bacterium]
MWLEFLGYFIIGVYSLSLIYVTVFCLMQLQLLFRYFIKPQIKTVESKKSVGDESWPFVTIQLPVFNEKYVVARLIDNIVSLDYPKDRFEIQILDDSVDETTEIINEKVKEYAQKGFQIHSIKRTDRKGFKAGALEEAMSSAKGEFIAIFDADFLPETDFLKATIPSFDDPGVGVVQTRWAHINQNYSILTELQAFQLNVHFTIEQKGRYNAGYLLQFNGTAGVWRKACITDAGGWESDTLTEDLDLSYRAQLKGWKINYLEEVTAPAELPSDINGLKSQQFRWMKGGAETAKKILPAVWSSDIILTQKVQATIHLLSSSIFIFVFILGVFSVPLLFILNPLGLGAIHFFVYLISLLSIILVYGVANVGVAWPKEIKLIMIFKFVLLFPVFVSLSMGLAFHNSLAVLQGFFGKTSAFVRTPKYGASRDLKSLVSSSYFAKKMGWVSIGEGCLSVYFFIALYFGWKFDMKEFFTMHFLLALGYLMLFLFALKSRFTK